ncbi:MAG: DNA polymerase III subunit alpha [Rhodospirillales bacterium]|jgi:DNA polymerase-3 subunit alpha|nr:DNA polymerase III subunit alpha [Rhodospirillales bacterium]
MNHAGFVHLHVHSAYSLLEGMVRVDEVVARCRDARMPAVAITDTNNLFGALEFSAAAAAGGVQPIIGCQLNITYASDGGAAAKNGSAMLVGALVLLAQSDTGYRNLLKLVSRAHVDNDGAAKPQVSVETLEAHGDGLIAMTGGADGAVATLLANGQDEACESLLDGLGGAFPGRLYVELTRHGTEVETRIEAALIALADARDLPLVATNEVYFGDAEQFSAHDALLCVAEGSYVGADDRRRLTPEYYFKSADEMRALFADLPEAVENTLVIARRCAFMAETRAPILPPFPCPEGRTEAEQLRLCAADGLENRLRSDPVAAGMPVDERERTARHHHERLQYELDVIIDMGFAGYFLIVADFIGWAKGEGIPVGPGRGSGAGSVVSWSLGITDLDPLRFGLLFERFLNPERVSMPDFDIDFCRDRRDEVIRYVRDKYGRDRVAQIITFGTLQARAVIRDVGRVLQIPYSQVDRVCKLIPNNPANPVSLDQALEGDPYLRQSVERDADLGRLVKLARPLEGLYRHASTHAAGVVIGDRPLDELIPLTRDARTDMLVTGFSMKWVEQAGLVKFDFLGLKTLTVLAHACDLLKQRGVDLDLSHLALDDETTFEMIGRGDTTGVFQLESSGMRDVLRKLKPDTFEDIIAVVSLFRPGPMDNIPSYIQRKHGKEAPDYLYPTLEGILKETFGIIIYQEQVMQIAQELAGYSLGHADLLRRAMGKKIKSEMDQQRQVFIEGATARGAPEAKASHIFELVAKFAGYGFNKSHAAAYALVAYQTAYLKANHPVEFFAASMTLDMGNTEKLDHYRGELKNLDIPLVPPDINESGISFTVGEDEAGRRGIRFALAAIKNVGEAAMEAVVKEREANGRFRDLLELTQRIDARLVNKRQLECLAAAGAFESLGVNRRRVFEGAETLVRHAQAAASDRTSHQIGLFGKATAQSGGLQLPDVAEWPKTDLLGHEFAVLGFNLSAHPLDEHGDQLRRRDVKPYSEVLSKGRSGPVNLAGTIRSVRERSSGKGNRYAFVQLSDQSSVFEVTVFSELLTRQREILEVNNSIFVRASAEFEHESVRLTAQALEPLANGAGERAPGVTIRVESSGSLKPLQATLARGAAATNGNGAAAHVALVTCVDSGTEVKIGLPGRYALSAELLQVVRTIPGVLDVREG